MDKVELQIKSKPDYWLAICVFALVIFGIVMISSASVVKSLQITDGISANYFLTKQLSYLVFGLLVWGIFQNIDYRFWQKTGLFMLFISIVLLILVFIPALGVSAGGTHRWIGIGSRVFQPSELVKLTFLIYLCSWFSSRSKDMKSLWKLTLPFGLLVTFIILLIIWEPDIGTASIIGFISLWIFILAGGNLIHLAIGLPIVSSFFWLLVKAAPYRMSRIIAFFNPSSDVYGISYHINQAIIAIGSGGIWGVGFGQSIQKYSLPEAHTDSIFAITGEELGFIRSAIIILLFVFLAFRGFRIAKAAPDQFGRLLASGITIWFVFQALINISAMLRIVPVTGVPLPFISYGGSSLIFSLAGVGILLNISKYAKVRDEKS